MTPLSTQDIAKPTNTEMGFWRNDLHRTLDRHPEFKPVHEGGVKGVAVVEDTFATIADLGKEAPNSVRKAVYFGSIVTGIRPFMYAFGYVGGALDAQIKAYGRDQ
jgi:hypothetical protein